MYVYVCVCVCVCVEGGGMGGGKEVSLFASLWLFALPLAFDSQLPPSVRIYRDDNIISVTLGSHYNYYSTFNKIQDK